MNFGKIFLLWQQACYNLVQTPLATWFSLLAVHMLRFYKALCTTYALLIPMLLCALAYFYYVPFYITLVWLSLIMYLMRPTVELKNRHYIQEYFSPELLVSTFAVVLFLYSSSLVLPLWLHGLVSLYALVLFSFLYDAAGAIPRRCWRSLTGSIAFMIYQAPLLIPLAVIACLAEYYVLSVLNLFIIYPVLSAIITIFYIQAIHENYELYYAE